MAPLRPRAGEAEIELYGVMCDGAFVLGCPELDGSMREESDLDAQNGHVGDRVDRDGTTFLADRYPVHACVEFGRTHTPEMQYTKGSACDGRVQPRGDRLLTEGAVNRLRFV